MAPSAWDQMARLLNRNDEMTFSMLSGKKRGRCRRLDRALDFRGWTLWKILVYHDSPFILYDSLSLGTFNSR